MAKPALARFGGSVLDRLDAKLPVGPSVGQAQRIPLNLIEEDPGQPRRVFNEGELQSLAASIRMVGILQPVGVAQAGGGRYLLRWGGRRLRAAKLAGLSDIPAVLVAPNQAGLEAQVIENQHRASNTDSELAAAIATLTERGMKNAEIATVLALPDPQALKYYRALVQVQDVPALAAHIDRAPARALYELHAVWQRGRPEQRQRIADALAETEELTVTSARRIVSTATEPVPEAVVASASGPSLPASEPQSAPSQKAKREAVPDTADPDAGRVAKVRAWLADPTRPRPSLSV